MPIESDLLPVVDERHTGQSEEQCGSHFGSLEAVVPDEPERVVVLHEAEDLCVRMPPLPCIREGVMQPIGSIILIRVIEDSQIDRFTVVRLPCPVRHPTLLCKPVIRDVESVFERLRTRALVLAQEQNLRLVSL